MSMKRKALTQTTKDRLWSESGGHCQNPACRVDLHALSEKNHVAEFAHIVPAKLAGPRSDESLGLTDSERARPENILVLCSTCHTLIDKNPTEYPATILRSWKKQSILSRASAHGTPKFTSRAEAKAEISALSEANSAIYSLYGPRVDEFDDDRSEQWRRHLVSTILPNNRRIVEVLERSISILNASERETLAVFRIHVKELEERHTLHDWTPGSTKFPSAMGTILEDLP